MNLAVLIAQKASIHPERIAIVDAEREREYSYEELAERVGRCASYLATSGVLSGQTVAYIGENCIEALDLLLACSRMGAIFVPVNFRLAPPEVEALLEDAQPVVVFHSAEFSPLATAAGRAGARYELADSATYLDSPVLPEHSAHPSADQCLALIYTSGSSGRPKGVMQTHANAFFRALAGVVDFDLTSQDVVLVAAPLFHVAGLNALTLSVLHVGGRIVLQARFRPEQTVELIRAHRISCFAVVPTVLKMIAAAGNCSAEALGTLRFVLVGGEPLDPALQQQWLRLGVELLNVFGMSETADGVLYQRVGERAPAGCIGRPATYAQVRIEGADGPGRVGELWIGGPTVSPGYWRADELSRGLFRHGWVNTGDLAYRDHDDQYYLVGRADDLIKSGAEKIVPAELERVIASLPQVAEVVVFGVPDPEWGQTPRAVISTWPGETLDVDTVLNVCARHLARYKKPRSVIIVDELPVSGSGKIDRARIKLDYGENWNAQSQI